MNLFTELKRRNVFRVGLFYVVVGWLVIQVAETVLPVFNVPDVFVRGIIVVLAIGFVPALVFAWAFELTPEGIRRETDAEVSPQTKQQTAYKLNWATLIAAVLAIGLLAADRMMPEPTGVGASLETTQRSDVDQAAARDEGPDPASIAVLPFADLSPQGDQQYFSDGIAEEILNVLSKIEALNVTSRTSAFAFKSQSELSIRDIADELQVRHVLEGSVRKAADTIRVTAQLIDAGSDQHVWSETYDRQLSAENVFAIQDEIAQAITYELAERLNVRIETDGARVDGGTRDIDAYEAFLAGREMFINRNYVNLPRAIRQLELAVEADSDFARARGWLAMAYAVSPSWGFQDREYKALARRSAEAALDPGTDNAAALTALAFLAREKPENDYPRSIDLFERAISVDPQFTTAHVWMAQSWRNLGFFEKADRAAESCLKIDPEYPICIYTYAEIASLQGRYERSIERMKPIFGTSHQEGYPQFLGTVSARGDEMLLYLMLRELADMVGPDMRWMVADLLRALGDEDYDRDAALDRLEARIRSERAPDARPVDAYTATAYYLAFGAYDRVPQDDSEDAGWWWFKGYPGLAESPARKQAMIDSGLPRYWFERGFPPQCRPVGEDDFECE